MNKNKRHMDKWFIQSLWIHRDLILRMSWRDISGRYRGSVLGLAWSVIQPVAMLSVYTIVFSGIFKSRWGGEHLNGLEFAANLFAGLIVFNLFADCTTRAPRLIVEVPNYVKKVIFPIEILPAVSVLTASFHALTGLFILLIAIGATGGGSAGMVALLPLVWLPVLLASLAVSWPLAALGVYIRDINQVTGVAVNMLLFLSGVFYPVQAMPGKWQHVLLLNPLLQCIEATRALLINGHAPPVGSYALGCLATLGACQLSYVTFQSLKKGFADVI